MPGAKCSMLAAAITMATLCGGWGFVADPGHGKASGPATERTFANPILPGMHPDPSICRVGQESYTVRPCP